MLFNKNHRLSDLFAQQEHAALWELEVSVSLGWLKPRSSISLCIWVLSRLRSISHCAQSLVNPGISYPSAWLFHLMNIAMVSACRLIKMAKPNKAI